MKNERPDAETKDEAVAYEAAQLISGSFTYQLYSVLWANFFDMETITGHLEAMYDSGNHFGLVYFIFMLAEAVDYTLPRTFAQICATDALVPVLSAAIIEDWLDYDATSEVDVIESDI
jgi:hypothetical protein